jgi:hypothetical protein
MIKNLIIAVPDDELCKVSAVLSKDYISGY